MIFFKIKLIIPYCIILCLILSCKQYYRNKSHAGVPVANIEKGELLAQRHCQSCHSLPDPSLLDAQTWKKGVLPVMGPMLGIFHHEFEQYPSGRNDRDLDSNFYPSKPLLEVEQWQHIIDYYTATSPDTLPPQDRKIPAKTAMPFFNVQVRKIQDIGTCHHLFENNCFGFGKTASSG